MQKIFYFKNKKFLITLFVCAFLFCACGHASAATIYANYSTGNDTTGNGTSGSPYKTFTKAYAMSSANDTLDLTGTFDWSNADETGVSSGTTGFTIAKALTIQGHGADQTIIQAASTPNTAGKRVFYSTANLILKDLTVRYAYENSAGFSGSAIKADANLTIIECWIDQNKNHADRYVNGAIFTGGTLIVRNSTISNNENGYAGGIYAYGTTEITNSTFFNNYGEYYGALYISGGTARITNSTFYYNKGTVSATDIGIWTATAYIKNTIMAVKQTGAVGNFYNGNSGTTYDGGYNIVETQQSNTGAGAPTAVFVNGTNGNLVGVQANLNISSSLATNSTATGVPTLALLANSVAIDAGDPNDAANSTINVPMADERNFYRNGRTDIGAYEYGGSSSYSRPTAQASNISFSSVTWNQMTVNWTNGNGMRRIVFMKQASSGTTSISDNTTYTDNATFGSGTQADSGWYAVYSGTGTSVTVTGLSVATNYIVQVFEYSGVSGSELYDSADVATATQATTAVTAPATQASNIAFSSVGYTSMTISWTSGSGSKRAVFIKAASSGTASPVDNTAYTASTTFGNGTQIGTSGWYCVYNGTGASVTIASGLTAGTTYIVQVFDYNYSGANYTYKTDTATNNPNTQATTSVVAPTTQAYSMTFSSIGYTGMTISWTKGNSASNTRAVFVKAASSGTASPADNTSYTANTAFGSGTQIGTSGWYCVYNSTGTSVTISGLVAGTTYIAEVIEYNTSGALYAYNTNSATNNPNTQATTSVVAPSTQASNIAFSSINYGQMTIGWTSGNGASRVVFAKQASSGTASPADNISYTASTTFGSGTQIGNSGWYAIYNSTGTSVTVTGLSPVTSYIFEVIEYNSSGSSYSYNVNSATNNPNTQATIAVPEPATQASSITFSSVSNSQMTIGWTNGNGANRAVFVRADSSGAASPVDNTTYTANTAFGSGTQIGTSGWYCVYNSTGTSVVVTGLSASTTYIAQVFEYNGTAGIENYLADSAASNPNTQATTAAPTEITIGSGTSATGATTPSPVNIWYRSLHGQSIYTATELNTAGASGAQSITKVGFYIASAPNHILNNFTIRMKNTANANVANWETSTGMSTVYGPANYTPTAGGFDSITLTTPFSWDGTSNIVVDTAFDMGSASYDSQTGTVRYYSATSGYRYAVSDSANETSIFSGGSTSTYKPQIKFSFSQPTTYTLTYTAGANGSISGTSPQTVSSGSNGSAVTPTPSAHYHFVNWSDSSTANPRTDANVQANISVTANFAIDTYTLTYAAGTHGSLTGTASQTVNYNASGSAVTAVADTGYQFTSWSDASTTNPRTDSNVTQNISVTANFSLVQSTTIYVNSSTGNDSTGNGSSGSPYKTFTKGYAMSSAGGTLDLTGTFTWTNVAETGDAVISGYTISKNLTIQGHGSDQTILQAASADNIADRRVLTIASGVTVVINDLAIRYGRINSTSLDGGGILNNGTTTVNDCEIYNNRAPGSYGGGVSNWNKFTLNRSTVYNNVANYMGGGMVNSYYVAAGGYLNITNSTIAYNQITAVTAYRDGGGVHYRKGNGTITNSTIAYNTACDTGGLSIDDTSGTITIKNTILANNIQMVHSYCNNGLAPRDFGLRSAGMGNVVDGGYNIIGYSNNYTWTNNSDWIGAANWAALVNRTWNRTTFTLKGDSTTGSLNLDASLAVNNNANKTQTLALKANSIAIDNGGTGTNGTVSVPSTDQRENSRAGNTDIGAFEYDSAPADITAPTISGISSIATDDGAIISWSTNEESSSQVKYDPCTYLTTRSAVYDSTVKTIGHEVSLSNLVSCSKYYYAVISQDDAGNVAVSETQTFTTTGCVGRTSISNISELVFTPATTNGAEVDADSTASDSDYSVNHTSGNLTFGLNIPRTFSDVPTSLQVKDLSATNVISSLSKPTNYNTVGTSVFDIKALSDPGTTVSTIASAATVTLSYSASDVVGIDESTLKIYRNEDDGNGWHALDNCSVDTTAKIVTCTTTNFSVFGLFGEESQQQESPVTTSGGGGGGGTSIYLSQQISDQMRLEQLKKQIADLQAQIAMLIEVKNGKQQQFCKSKFNHDLYLGIIDEDVRQLQIYLNNNGFELTGWGDGSKGRETTMFGLLTRQALIKFQKANKINPAWGFFGPTTRSFVNNLR